MGRHPRPWAGLALALLVAGCAKSPGTIDPGAVEPSPASAPVIHAFGASPPSVAAGSQAQLSWSVTGATSLAVDQGVGPVAGTTAMVTPAATTSYTLTATNGSGSATATATVTVLPAALAPSIGSFTATPASIRPGESATLAWAVSGATGLSIDQSIGPVTGTSTPVTPAATTTYTLTATNGSGSASASATVTVSSIASLALHCGTVTAGGSLTLTATVTAAAGTPAREIDWSVPPSSAGSVAPARGIVTSYTAPAAPGSHQVNGRSVWDPSKTASCQVTVAPAPGSLTARRDMPTPRVFHTAAEMGGRLYVFGGRIDPLNTASCCEASIHAYDPDTDLWTTPATSMPVPRESAVAVALGGKIYVTGGLAAGGGPQEQVHAYDPASNTWSTEAPMLAPRQGHAAAVVDGKVYVLGGGNTSGATPVATVEEYDPATRRWTAKASMPTARLYPAAAAAGGKIYLMGGFAPPSNTLSVVEAYDPVADQWTARASMPAAASEFGAAAAASGRVYAFGGAGGASANAIQEYDPVSNSWTSRGPLDPPRYTAPAVALGAGIYLMGGYLQISPGTVTARTDLYTPR